MNNIYIYLSHGGLLLTLRHCDYFLFVRGMKRAMQLRRQKV